MKKFAILIAFILCLPGLIWAVRYPYPYYPLPEYSAATTFGGLSIFQNPAALAVNQDIELMYMHSFGEDRFAGDNTLFLSRNGLGFVWQNYHLSVDNAINAYSLAFSTRISRGFYAGTTYTFMKTEPGNPYHNDHFWNAGLLWRYRREVSFGFMARNLQRMEFAGNATQLEYLLALGLKPLGEQLSLSADWSWNEGQSCGDGFLKIFGSFLIKEGLSLCGAVDEDGNFGIGLNFSFGRNQFGTYHNFAEESGYHSGLIYSGYTYRPHGWVLPLKKKFLNLRLSGSYPETADKAFLWHKRRLTFTELILTLKRALQDSQISGVYVELDHPVLGWAQLEELRQILLAFRASGKPVLFYLGNLSGNGSYYLASCGNKIGMRHLDDLVLVGLLAEITFYKGALEKLGVEAEMVKAGKYKSGADIFSQDTISVPHREAIDDLLDNTFDNLVTGIASSRGIAPENLLQIIDEGPFTSQEARAYGLVDSVLYPDEIRDWQSSLLGSKFSIDFEEYRAHPPFREIWGEPPQIAVIPVEGTLLLGRQGSNPLLGRISGEADLAAAIKYAARDKNIKAVILRLNTPGGSGLAADLLHRELQLLKEKKPVVVSMGNVAASAGYHLASAGTYIYALTTTITGSIGVFYGKPNLSGLYENIGLNVYHLKRGKNADIFSWSTGFRAEQRLKMGAQIDLMYLDFVQKVAAARGLSSEYVDSIAQGRVWSGQRACELHLIDEIGGFNEALSKAIELGGLTENDYEILSFPKRPFEFTVLLGDLSWAMQTLKSLIMPSSGNLLAEEKESSFLYILPFTIKIY